jgi:hypothetical protein
MFSVRQVFPDLTPAQQADVDQNIAGGREAILDLFDGSKYAAPALCSLSDCPPEAFLKVVLNNPSCIPAIQSLMAFAIASALASSREA